MHLFLLIHPRAPGLSVLWSRSRKLRTLTSYLVMLSLCLPYVALDVHLGSLVPPLSI